MTVEVDGAGPAPTRGASRRAPRREPLRWFEALPTGVLLVALVVKAIVSPNAARDALTNVRPLAVTLAVGAAWVLLWLVALPRLVRRAWVRAGILLVVAIGLSIALVLPSARDTKVVEAFPTATSSPPTTTGPGATEQGAPPSTAAAEPRRLGSASLRGIDHDATGTATLYEQPDGTFVVGLEDIDIEPGPDYVVYVVPGLDQSEPGDQGVELDELAGNQGTQFYPVPASTDVVAGEWTVLVWCRVFAVPIANATPA